MSDEDVANLMGSVSNSQRLKCARDWQATARENTALRARAEKAEAERDALRLDAVPLAVENSLLRAANAHAVEERDAALARVKELEAALKAFRFDKLTQQWVLTTEAAAALRLDIRAALAGGGR